MTRQARASLPGHRPRCVDGPATGDPHDVTGPHRERCREHLGDYTRWRKARDTYVRRLAAKAAEAGEGFDEDRARRDREQRQPYRPITRSDRARGAMPLLPEQVRALRATLAALLEAKQPLDTSHREGLPVDRSALGDMLTAVEKHASLVAGLLKDVRR